jgi:hypothetical protein
MHAKLPTDMYYYGIMELMHSNYSLLMLMTPDEGGGAGILQDQFPRRGGSCQGYDVQS